ncbi:hypothetical protein NQ314_009913 [Rhamnusium bicolor]|uniref:Protein hunchback n=1 Tax=Rhamnusium bicolor TaxID=1586634 RepID=A0AAV8XVE3_9CUCU|nr:hypothetical protein NQ314_009913 [Rhamnusium bicolor]
MNEKQESMDEEKNDSGINSGSDFHSSSPGSDHSENNPYSSPTANQMARPVHQSPYRSTPPTRMDQYQQYNSPSTHFYHSNHNNLTPLNLKPAISNNDVKTEIDVQQTALTPDVSSAEETTPHTSSLAKNNDHDDPLKELQMSLEKNGMLPRPFSPKFNEYSGEDENKSDNEMNEYDERGLIIPKVNSHGKVKKFKCKQCDFVANIKEDYWKHHAGHIKAEKLLTCPKCPFVTEYKHHLEYHLRNHFGSKPFKCSECNYSCVNKSMLNSHLKSHSSVYQFRCADCNYASKYCHSLKLHLRKYSHKPDMVLNPDGTPNPLPIIDVYGTRRGPKVKGQERNSIDEAAHKSEQPVLPFPLNHFMMNTPQMPLPFAGFPFFTGFPGAVPDPLLLKNLENFVRERQGLLLANANDKESSENMQTEMEVLDLSKPEVPAQKNRRKGHAYKFNPEHGNSSDDEEVTTMFSNVEVVENKEAETCISEESSDYKEEISNNNNKDDYSCQYCQINFGDPVLYTMHMGYHGYKNPFACNMCGEVCKDKVSFFLHIARTSHS